METSSSKSVLPVLVFFLLLLLILVTFSAISFRKAIISKNWPTTIGTIVSSEVKTPSGKNTKYEAEINYSYKIDTKEYLSNKFKATRARGTSEWAKNVINQLGYRVGSSDHNI
jgi:hypothetical protein